MSVKEVLEGFGKRLQQQAKSNLSKSGRKDTGELYDSISYKIEVNKNSFSFSFTMEDYAMFVDQGVKGAKSRTKAPNSPFRYGSGTGQKGGLTSTVDGWVKRNRIQFRDRKTGRFMNYKQTAFLITRSIYNTGTRPTHFFTKPFENEFRKLPKEVVSAYGLEVNKLMKFVLKK